MKQKISGLESSILILTDEAEKKEKEYESHIQNHEIETKSLLEDMNNFKNIIQHNESKKSQEEGMIVDLKNIMNENTKLSSDRRTMTLEIRRLNDINSKLENENKSLNESLNVLATKLEQLSLQVDHNESQSYKPVRKEEEQKKT